jgi:DNA repair exonuclease SbcCD ATPase subunit
MIRRIILENYMAHGRTVIEPAAGLTVLVGPNNCGKSAVVHALEMLCYNSDAADYAIRHGAKKAVVTVETEDDDGTAHTITWWRKEKTAGYIIDGREISGLGRGKIPDDLHQHLRMPMIESSAGGKEFLLHFGLQKSPIFLLDDPSSRAAQFFASATDADKLVQMQKSHQQKVTYAKRDKEKLDRELEHLDQQLQTLTPLSALSQQLNHLENAYGELSKLSITIGSMNENVEALDRVGKSAAINASRIQTLLPLQKPPALQETQRLREWILEIDNVERQHARWIANARMLAALAVPPELLDTTPLMSLRRELDSAIANTRRHERQCDAAKLLVAPPRLENTGELQGHIEDIARTMDAGTRQSRQIGLLSSLSPLPESTDPQPLNDLIGKIAAATRTESQRLRDVQRLHGEIERFRGEVDQWVMKHPRCDACGQSVSTELVTSGGHSHD